MYNNCYSLARVWAACGLTFTFLQFYNTTFYDVTLLLPDRAKYLYN